MKRWIGLGILLCASFASSQMSTTGTITATAANCLTQNACVVLGLFNTPALSTQTASIVISGTFTATLQFEASVDNVNWASIAGTPLAGGSTVTSATAGGTWVFAVAGMAGIRVRSSAWTSAPTVTIQASASTGGIGALVLAGSTSGGATLTAPAVAGTITNPIVSSNYFSVPGLIFTGSAPPITTSGTTPYLNINTLMKDTQNTCTFALTTAQLTLALSPVSLCSWTLPNAAVTWYWQCSGGWSVTAGTTPTIAVGVTWAQAPSAAFQMANILTANTGTSTQLTTSTTTNAAILTSPTLTPAATVFQATASGWFTGSATSGTFSPTAILTGVNAVGTFNGGCTIQ